MAGLYDAIYQSRNQRDINFFVDYSLQAKAQPWSWAAARVACSFRPPRRACQISGLDLSPYMLNKCRQKLRRQPEEIQNRVRLLEGT